MSKCTCDLKLKQMKSAKKFSFWKGDSGDSIQKSSIMKAVDTSNEAIEESCAGPGLFKQFGGNLANQLTFGIIPAPEVDTTILDELRKANDQLKDNFNSCKMQLTDCKVDQVQELLSQQMELSTALQKLTDSAQDMSIQKNYSLSVFTLGVVGLIVVYILASPTYRPPEKVF